MNQELMQKAVIMKKGSRRRKVWTQLVRMMAIAVVFCTTYVLILPALTIQSEPVCGLEEHVHTDSCYEAPAGVELACVLPEDAVIIHQHGAACLDDDGQLICRIPEKELHVHHADCYTETEEQVCTVHIHSSLCARTESVLVCGMEEQQAHIHDESCYEIRQIPCEEPTDPEHVHTEDCVKVTKTLSCAETELHLHSHEDTCYDEAGSLTCVLQEVVEHVHSDSCAVETDAVPVLICTIPEHIHENSCYPVKEDAAVGTEYICGFAVHAHNQNCVGEDGTVTCSIPEHEHEASCLVEDLDLTADVESRDQWDAEMAQLPYSGVWAEDLVMVAKHQLGYRESGKNCVLEGDVLKGYTRYGHWYGDSYADWDDMFVSFCLHYSQITKEYVPYESDTLRWIEALEEKGLFAGAENHTPRKGDLVFWDSDRDDEADMSGIIAEVTEEGELKVIAGDTGKSCVDTLTFKLADEEILGFCVLPENPVSQDQWNDAEAVSALLAELPEAEAVRESFRKLNAEGDKAGYNALRQELAARIEAAESAYSALSEEQKALVMGLEKLDELKEVCGGESWQAFAELTDDGAVISSLTAEGAEVIAAVAEETEETEESAIPEKAICGRDTVLFHFTAEAQSYYTDVSYGMARVKVELVLPLTEAQAAFDLDAMDWLEEAVLTEESRLINEEEVICQVLTGYKKLSADEVRGIVVPGTFTETAVVNVLDMIHGEKLYLIISAAMEHGAWDGTCEAHGAQEKLTVVTDVLSVYDPQPAEVRQANYEAYMQQITDIEERNLSDVDQYFEVQGLLQKIRKTYQEGGLDDAHMEELASRIEELSNINLNTVAEPCVGTNWMKLTADTSVDYGSESATLNTAAKAPVLQAGSAMPADTYSELFPSSVQIDREGGSNVSDEGAVMVSKTIEGTDIENVFDITLQIVTRDEVNEVYKDPDMAVVVVMDISNTMRSNFGDVTRYQAAMTAGESFLKKFASQNSVLSRVGYVAFNTSAHKVFDLSVCNTTAQANSLTSTMKSKTGSIINADGYASSSTRFTNMQAGLRMAADMLANATNQHKYIIFISDGFPTTYLKSGYTGYNPSSSSGTKDNDGVFYDDTLNKWCMYGTSYSDTAAIKARQLAVQLKADGVNIFSIGVDVGGQTLWSYHNQSVNADGFSVVERRNEADYYRNNGYEIGTMHDEIDKTSVTNAEKTAMAQDFKNWLKGSATTGIGSGYYYDSTDLSGLNAAYDAIFKTILELNASSSHLDWVTTDPMPDMGVHEVEAMEFISFWDLDENGDWVLVADNLTGESRDGNLYDNTADFHEDTQTIHWDIKKSGYVSQAANNTTTYLCELKYRVRLKNEESVFVEGEVYDTNDVTTLTYRIIEVEGEKTTISERRTISFPIPAVHGYLAELNFQKIQPTGNPLEGAEFTLSHDTANCVFCRGDGENYVAVADQVATSDRYGMISFTRIPSGHTYTLKETVVPDGFIATKNTYQVVVSYDALTVTVTDADGNELEWNETIENDMYYALPNTGSTGTSHLTFGGLLLIAGSLMYICITGRKRRKEER